VIEAADSAPLFHNNEKASIEDAVAFYTRRHLPSCVERLRHPTQPAEIDSIGAFLRVLNAAEHPPSTQALAIRAKQSLHRNTDILTIAIATSGRLDVLTAKNLKIRPRGTI